MNAAPAIPFTLEATALRLVGGLRLNVYHDITSLEGAWRQLQDRGIASVYQTFDWCQVWLRNVGTPRGIEPCVVVGETVFGEVKFILPLQLRRKFGLSIIEMLTAPQGAYAFGVFNRSFLAETANDWFSQHLPDIVAALPSHDVFRLADAPAQICGFANPLLACGSFLAANQSHIMELQPDFQALLEQKRTSETRRSLRKRDNKLEAAGRLEFGLPQSMSDTAHLLTTMFADQEQRLAESGIHNLFSAQERQFVCNLAHVTTPEGPLLRPYALRIQGEVQAVLLGAYYGNTYWALISSLADTNYRKLSPGDYALRAMFKSLCEDGTGTIDFAAGDSAYKLHWSDQMVPLHFVVRASSIQGLLPALLMMIREKCKRVVKQTPMLRQAAFALRKLFAGKKPSA